MSWREILKTKPQNPTPQIPQSPEFTPPPNSGDTGISGGGTSGLFLHPEVRTLPADETRDMLAWLAAIGETDPELIADILDRCARDPAARAFFVHRAREAAEPPDPAAPRHSAWIAIHADGSRERIACSQPATQQDVRRRRPTAVAVAPVVERLAAQQRPSCALHQAHCHARPAQLSTELSQRSGET